MSKKESDLFHRLRDVGMRKQVAQALSELDEKAGKKAQRLGRGAASELRALADEIERRLPKAAGAPGAGTPSPPGTPRRTTSRTRAAATPGAAAGGAAAAPKTAARPTTRRTGTTTPRRRTTTPKPDATPGESTPSS